MSAELSTNYQGAANLYAVLRDPATGNAWDGTALVTWDDTDIDDYDVILTNRGGDLYAADFPDDAPAGTYRAAYYKRAGATPATTDLLLRSESLRWNGSTVSTPTPGDAEGHYADQSDIESWYGVRNVTIYSNVENEDEVADVPRIQAFLDRADAWIDLAFAAVNRDVPVPSTEGDFLALTDVAAEWTGAMLYLARGTDDKNRGIAGKMQARLDHAESRLAALVAAWVLANPDDATGVPAGTMQLVPIERVAECAEDENSG